MNGTRRTFSIVAAVGAVAFFATSAPATAQCGGDDNFDFYPPGSSIHGQGGWKGIDNDPFFTANVSSGVEPAQSPPQSVIIENNANIVRESNCLGESTVRISIFQYIPNFYAAGAPIEPDPGASYRLFNTYFDGATQLLSAGIRFDPIDSHAKFLFGDGTDTVDVPYIVDQWVPIDVVVDLENDYTRVFYGGSSITEYQWTAGVDGLGSGAPDVSAVDLFANGSATIFYDDFIIAPIPKLQDDFDLYGNGSDIHGQGGWKGFDDNPAAGADVTQDQARSLPQSLKVEGAERPVHETVTWGAGVWSFEAWQYIPSDFDSGTAIEVEPGSVFRLHDTYQDGGAKNTSAECRVDSTLGNLECFQGAGTSIVVVPLETDRWVKLQAIVDLDDDWTQIYYDDELVTEYVWTGGITGAGGGALDIAGIDLFGNGATPLYYDDLRLEGGCGTGRTSDYDGDGRSAGQELREGTDSCIPEPPVPALGPGGAVAALWLLALAAAGVLARRRAMTAGRSVAPIGR